MLYLYIADILCSREEKVSLPFKSYGVVFTLDSQVLVSWADDGTGVVVNRSLADDGTETLSNHKDELIVMDFVNRQGRIAAVAQCAETLVTASISNNFTVVPIDLATGQHILWDERYDNVDQIALSPDDQMLATLAGDCLRLLKVRSVELIGKTISLKYLNQNLSVKTPVVKTSMLRSRYNMLSAVTAEGKMDYSIQDGTVNWRQSKQSCANYQNSLRFLYQPPMPSFPSAFLTVNLPKIGENTGLPCSRLSVRIRS